MFFIIDIDNELETTDLLLTHLTYNVIFKHDQKVKQFASYLLVPHNNQVSRHHLINTMKVSVATLNILSVLGGSANAFIPLNNNGLQIVPTSTSSLNADAAVPDASTESSTSSPKSLGLLTFDLDDTLYPIAQIVEDANGMYLLLNVLGTKFVAPAISRSRDRTSLSRGG